MITRLLLNFSRLTINRPPALLQATRFKNADRPKISFGKTKVASKRKTKYYKLKTHKGAMSR